jgi:nicotinate-nucleotide pyrophosphorylase (carboxylating)
MAAADSLPHDRGFKLWSAVDGPSRLLLASIDRWTSAILADDGIDMPLMSNDNHVIAHIIARESGMISGTAAVDHMLHIWAGNLSISWASNDGKQVSVGDEIAQIEGPREAVLMMERSILNILGFLSGITTEAKKWSTIAPKQIACTRKTTWGLLDKWAVSLGGGLTHRLSRNDAMMIKENDLATMHPDLDAHSSRIAKFLGEVDFLQCGAFLEIEVQEEKEAVVAAFTWSERRMKEELPKLVIMLDNFSAERCKAVVDELNEMGLREHVLIEASGGITLSGLKDWRRCGVDVLSTSAINRGVIPLDISMLIADD